jgi:Papain fold toxin 1, glutamine deamidase
VVTRSQLKNARPEAVVELARHWATAATTLESAADDYKGFLDKPGGQYWDGKTAEAAQSRAADDRKAVIGMADALTKLGTDTVNMMTESVMPTLKNARQLIENCEKHPGFTVNDDLSVSYTAPEGTSEQDEKASKDAVAGFAQQIKDAADTWWQAEQYVADQITAGQKGLAAHFNPLAGAMDPSEELRALQIATNQAVIDQLAKVKAAKDALGKAAALAYTHPNDPEGQAAFANRDKLAAEYGRALDDLGNIPDYSKVDPKGMSASADGHFLLGYTADGHPVQVTGQLKNGTGEIFDQAKQTYFTFQDGKLVGTRRLDSGSVRPDDELLFNAVTAAVGAPEMAAGVKVGGEAAWQGFKALLGREGLEGAGFGASGIAADNVLPKAFAAAESRAHVAADNLALEHAADIPRPSIGPPADHHVPVPISEHPTPLASVAEHPAPMDTRAHPPPAGSGDHPVTTAPDGLAHDVPIGPLPPESVGDIHKWLPEINHDPNGFDPLRTVNCGSCALAVDQRLSGIIPDARAGLGTLSTPQMEAATGLQQVPGTPAQIEQYLINQGAGAHTVIGVDRAGAPGHWFNAYYDGNNVYAIDGQTGQILGWPPAMDMAGHPVTNWDYGVRK